MSAFRTIVTALFALLAAALVLASPAGAQPRVSGMVFADALAALRGYSVPADTSAFRFRRVQLTASQDLDSTFSVLVQLEVDDGEVTSKGKSAAFLKQAWLRWSHLGPFGDFTFGESLTPTWALAERYWGYRSIEKTVTDLQGLGFATDMGLALQQVPSPVHPVGWHLMLSNDNGQKPENDATKRLSLSVPVRFGDFVLEGLGDFSGTAGPRDRWTAKLFAGWQHGVNAAGAEIYERVNAATGPGGADVRPAGVSVFAHHALSARTQAVGRVDWTDPDLGTSSAGYHELYFVAALDASPRAGIHLMPNALIRTYQAKASALPSRDPDITLRVTLWYDFK